METIRWRYQPEFRVSVTVDGQLAGTQIQLRPLGFTAQCMHNYQVVARPADSQILCAVKQNHNGTIFVPAVPLTTPCSFAFAICIDRSAPALDFFAQGTTTFGRRVLYVNNLNAAGAIDANLAGGIVRLTPAADVVLTDAGSLAPAIISSTFAPGTFTDLRVGKVRSGAAINFTINQSILPTDRSASADMSLQENGSYVVQLDGGAPINEQVIIDPVLTATECSGIVEIFRDAWFSPAQPRNYTMNFTTV